MDKNHINNCVRTTALNHTADEPHWSSLSSILTGQKRNGILIVFMKHNIVTEQIIVLKKHAGFLFT